MKEHYPLGCFLELQLIHLPFEYSITQCCMAVKHRIKVIANNQYIIIHSTMPIDTLFNRCYDYIMVMENTTGWGYYQQGAEQLQELEKLGLKLNYAIQCPVHYPAWGKRLFECKHGILFPVFFVSGHTPEQLKELHP